MNVANKLTTILPLLLRLSEEIISPVPQYTPRPSIHEPSSDERREICLLTRCLQNTLQEAEAALKVLQEAAEFIRTQKQRFTRSLKLHNSLMAPINHLPFDLLSRISIDAHDLDLFDFNTVLSHKTTECNRPLSAVYSPVAPAITVAQVNHQWSQIAMNTPSLWSTVVFSANLNFGQQLLRASQWLNLSSRSPLSCFVVDNIWVDSDDSEHRKLWLQEPSLISLLLPHASRVCSLHLYGNFFPFLDKFRDRNAAFSSLERLAIDGGCSQAPSEKLLNAGRIKSFRLMSSSVISFDHFAFNWSSLESVSGQFSIQQLHRLWSIPSLRRCRILHLSWKSSGEGLLDLPTSHSLTCLWLDLYLLRPINTFRQLGHLPLLQSLTVGVAVGPDTDGNAEEFLSFLQASCPSLEYLSMIIEPPSTIEFTRQYLQLTQNLKRLDLKVTKSADFDRLCQILVEEPLVPYLRDLYLFFPYQMMDPNWTFPEKKKSNNSILHPSLKLIRLVPPGLSGREAIESIVNYWFLKNCAIEVVRNVESLAGLHWKHPYPGTEGL